MKVQITFEVDESARRDIAHSNSDKGEKASYEQVRAFLLGSATSGLEIARLNRAEDEEADRQEKMLAVKFAAKEDERLNRICRDRGWQ